MKSRGRSRKLQISQRPLILIVSNKLIHSTAQEMPPRRKTGAVFFDLSRGLTPPVEQDRIAGQMIVDVIEQRADMWPPQRRSSAQ